MRLLPFPYFLTAKSGSKSYFFLLLVVVVVVVGLVVVVGTYSVFSFNSRIGYYRAPLERFNHTTK